MQQIASRRPKALQLRLPYPRSETACRLILKTEAAITFLASLLDPEVADLHSQARIAWQTGAITPDAFTDTALVFVARGCASADASLHMLAKSAGATVNVVDQPHLCDATIERDNMISPAILFVTRPRIGAAKLWGQPHAAGNSSVQPVNI